MGWGMGRTGDNPDKAYFRSERFFNADSQWYFTTREVSDQGPYETLESAQSDLAAFLRWRSKSEPKAAPRAVNE